MCDETSIEYRHKFKDFILPTSHCIATLNSDQLPVV